MNKAMELYMNKRLKVLPQIELAETDEVKENSKRYVATILKNIEAFGFTLDSVLIDYLMKQEVEAIVEFYKDIMPIVEHMVGLGENMIPMYPNFPEQVMEMDNIELYINAIIHYLSLGTILPEYEMKKRFPLMDNFNLKVIRLGSKDDYENILTNLLKSKSSLSISDQEYVEFLIKTIDNVKHLIPSEIEIKENLTFATPLLVNRLGECKEILSLYTTATDVLRLAVVMCGGHPTLKKDTQFKHLRRKDRVMLLKLLENCKNIEEDMVRHKELWIKLGEKLHPTEFKKFKKVNIAFYKLRNGGKIITFRGQLEEAFENENIKKVVSLLSKRPGEFARSLDRVLRMISNDDKEIQLKDRLSIVEKFGLVTGDLPTPMLLNLKTFFSNRDAKYSDIRAFFPKGVISNAYVIDNNLEPLEKAVCDKIAKICVGELIRDYSKRENLGNVFIDKDLENILAPMVQRNASKTLMNLARGSKLKISDDTQSIRPFIYWKEPEYERVDLDLSALFLNEKFETINHISYTNLKNPKLGACHSGDITSAPHGASEYIDIDLKKAREAGVRYIIPSVYSFTQTPFKELPECFAGYMERATNTGEIFEPKTVKNKSDLCTDNEVSILFIIDLVKNEATWVDMGTTHVPHRFNNIESNGNVLYNSLRAIMDTPKPTMLEVAKLNAFARGNIVEDFNEADVVFSMKTIEELRELYPVVEPDVITETVSDTEVSEDELVKEVRIITPFETDIILSDFI